MRRAISFLLALLMVGSTLTCGVFAVSDTKSQVGSAQSASLTDIKRDGPYERTWSAKWIWGSNNTSKHNWMCFRKTVNIDTLPETAVARISADSRYWLWINGEMVVYEGSVKRGPTAEDCYFDEVELAPYLREGNNTIAALAWYFGDDSDYYSYKSSGEGGFIFEADLGGVSVITDKTWKVHREDGYLLSTEENDPGSQPNYRLAEGNILYDAAVAVGLEGWYLPGYDDSSWSVATEHGNAGDAPWGELWQRSIPLLKFGEIVDYENPEKYSAFASKETTRTVSLAMELPYNMQIQPYLEVEAPEGVKIEMTSDGSHTVRSSYITKEGVQSFECYGWMSAETLTYKIPAGVRIIRLGYRQTGYDTEFEGSFECDDDFYNRLWMESLWTLYVTMRDNYMDCPDRERAQWWGDVTNESHMTFYALGTESYLLYRKGVDTLIGWRGQTGDGDERVLPTVVPINSGHFELPMQQLAGVVGFWTYYQYTGEVDFLEQVYQPALDYLTLWDMGEDGLVVHRPGSWDWPDHGENYDVVVMENAWYYWACSRVLEMADVIGETKDNDYLIGRMQSIKKAYAELWDEDIGAYYKATSNGKPDDRGNALAVLSGLAHEDKYEEIIEVLKSVYNATPYMEKYVLDAMFMMGYDDDALYRMKERYRDMVGDSFTTLWEVFPVGGSHNHAWSGGPLVNLSADVAGVAPDTPGYDTYHVTPQLGSLNEVRCTVPSVKGDIVVEIDRTGEQCTLKLTSPEDTVARVGVPRFEGENTTVSFGTTVIFEDGKAKGNVSGVEYLCNDAEYIYFSVQPGEHTFKASVKGAQSADSYTFTLNATDGGHVKVNGILVDIPYTSVYAKGTEIALEAVTDENSLFEGWSGTYGSEKSAFNVVMSDNVDLKAVFAEDDEEVYHLIRLNDPDGTDIKVKINGVTYDLPHLAAVQDGEELTVEAVNSEAWDFVNWQGSVFSADSVTTLTDITDDMTISVQGAYRGNTVTGVISTGATVTVNNEYSAGTQWRASNLTDGVILNDGGITTTHWYVSDLEDGELPEEEQAAVTVDLGKNMSFDTVRIYPRGVYSDGEAVNFPVDYKIMISRSGSDTWTEVYSVQGQENPGAGYVEVQIDPRNARYVRLVVSRLGVPHTEGMGSVYRLQLSELEVVNGGGNSAGGTVTIDGENGSVKINGEEYDLPCELTYDSATLLAIEPVADSNYGFIGWTGDVQSVDRPLYINSVGDIELTADFKSTQGLMLEPSENLAFNKKASSSNSLESGAAWSVNNLTDGVTISSSANSGYSTNILSSTHIPELNRPTIDIDLGEDLNFNTLKLYPRTDMTSADGSTCNFPLSYEIQVRLDGEDVWRTAHTVTDSENPMGSPSEVTFNMQNARYVRIIVSKVSGGAANESVYYRVQLAEAEIYSSPQMPVELSLGGTVTSNDTGTENSNWSIDSLVDGKLRSEGRNEQSVGVKGYSSSSYDSYELSESIWLNVELTESTTVNQLILYPATDADAQTEDSGVTADFPTKFDVQVKIDDEYVTVASVDYGSAEYNVNAVPQVVEFDKEYNTADVRLVVHRLGIPAYNEQSSEKYRLRLAELYAAYIPDADAEFEDTYEGEISVTPSGESVIVAEDTLFTANVTPSDLTDNSIIYSLENADGTASDIAMLRGTLTDETVVMPLKAGEAYLVARMSNGLNTVSKTHITVDFDADAVTVTKVRIDSIGRVTLDKEAAIAAARAAYDALTEEEKKLVTNLATLEAAEEALAELQTMANTYYTVTFMDGEAVFETVSVKHGDKAEIDKLPLRETAQFIKYTFSGWADANGNPVKLDGITKDMTVYASYITECEHPFTDLDEGSYYIEAVEWALMNGVMNGSSLTKFKPDGVTDRAMIVTVLYRLEGSPDVSHVKTPFTDVKAGEWYADAIAWAYESKVVNGNTATTFNPKGQLTREQFATILYRYAKEVKGQDVTVDNATALDKYTDKSEVSSYAEAAVLWANVRGLIGGVSATRLSPKGSATRAQMATILHRYSNM